jgi:hypothetical protein
MLNAILSWLTGGFLDKVLGVIDRKVDSETRKEELKADVIETYIKSQTELQISRTWWFQLFFVIPLGTWFTSVIIYSMIWCQDCIWPQTFTIAALPPPLNEWAHIIILSLFGVGLVENYLNKRSR